MICSGYLPERDSFSDILNRPCSRHRDSEKVGAGVTAFSHEVRAVCETDDKYGRKVCTIMVGSLNANLEQVRLGMAMVYRKYARDQAYFAAEGEAKEARRGLWADENPISPWEWRHRSKQ